MDPRPRQPSMTSSPASFPAPAGGGGNSRAERLYQQAIEELKNNQRTQALTSLRLAVSFAPEEPRYAQAYDHVRMGGRLS